jgi:hypothetical protein
MVTQTLLTVNLKIVHGMGSFELFCFSLSIIVSQSTYCFSCYLVCGVTILYTCEILFF